MNSHQAVLLVMLDIGVAFDTVDDTLPTHILESVKSYLTVRTQCLLEEAWHFMWSTTGICVKCHTQDGSTHHRHWGLDGQIIVYKWIIWSSYYNKMILHELMWNIFHTSKVVGHTISYCNSSTNKTSKLWCLFFPLSHYLSFPLYVIIHFLPFPALSFLIVCHHHLSCITHCLIFPIVYDLLWVTPTECASLQ